MEAGSLGVEVRLLDFGAVGEIVRGVGRVVVDDEDVDGAGGLDEGPDGVVWRGGQF